MIYEPKMDDLKLDKATAAMRQTNLAILAHKAGDLDAAITLAGAADGLLPEKPSQLIFSRLRDNPQALAEHDKKEWVQILNYERDWLKHATPHLGPEITLTSLDAGFMIIRAMAKLPKWSDEMHDFKDWYLQAMRSDH
jgi:hypothetical protein